MADTPSAVDRDTLAAFYKSGASNFAAFKEAKAKRETGAKRDRPRTPPTTGVNAIKDLAASKSSVETPPADQRTTGYAAATPAPSADTTLNKSATINKSNKSLKTTAADADVSVSGSEAPQASPSPSASKIDFSNGAEAASTEYIAFLKQQQDLQTCHKKLEDTIGEFERERRNHQAELNKVRGQASEILAALEEGTNWNLASKYNVQQLIKDAQLKLQPRELFRQDIQPKYLDIVQQSANLQKLRQDHSNKELYNVFKAVIDNGGRRLERTEKEIKGSQLDATDMARLPDTLFIQLDHVLAAPTIQMELMDTEEKLEHLLFKLDETKDARAQALDDGEMQLAEKKYYNVVEIYEEVLEHVLEKLGTIEKAKKENEVFDKVRDQYQNKSSEESNKLKEAKEKLKQRCEADLKKIFSLKERVDAVEQQTVEKLAEERRRSDKLLAENAAQQEVTWAKIEELEHELERLETERYNEFKRRVLDKDKDEHRRMEYEKFCQVVDNHAQLLDLTIRNCDTAIHCITLIAEFVNSGFTTLANHLGKQEREHSDLLLDTHKQHLEMFRGLYLSLGELAHKKDKRIEEIDRAIQQSHIQQELAAETLNPNAKKYSDAKKELLRIRDDVEEDLNDLKEKAQVALNNFAISEKALHDSGIDFVHPTVEQQEQELELKAKMVEYKAIATGHVDNLPIKAELESIKNQMMETKRVVESVNRSTMSSSLPMIRAGSPAFSP
jgi:predicted HicB family RNase H-like nuclease|mmetsp:Transcript_6304/g.11785  ORF Transcript_6304/g.11785 Transcript_6304/m.11785 type:complete len:728 (+) Transcript_6304:86-2269(+)|eukprot:CAMPEP_0174286686 /NCGR_PEP_ID=MMETSP0809-20121228/12757_1 /TAXON_ID=73025 ORGANISM="Eutreptiella gymnastica-like, Strain CCMP1594" /NCGR_SAMPLE_ID=MMETSP0809 /ASSEMBLY_ACC=CAM_ASM_000658 /LENGTH=727 /DNA_ID=CAMNT_0015382855 /DNA_START=86 /DNA_END=2269 /DNA_ORIENTATION=-